MSYVYHGCHLQRIGICLFSASSGSHVFVYKQPIHLAHPTEISPLGHNLLKLFLRYIRRIASYSFYIDIRFTPEAIIFSQDLLLGDSAMAV